jgi:hypothetical protein
LWERGEKMITKISASIAPIPCNGENVEYAAWLQDYYSEKYPNAEIDIDAKSDFVNEHKLDIECDCNTDPDDDSEPDPGYVFFKSHCECYNTIKDEISRELWEKYCD